VKVYDFIQFLDEDDRIIIRQEVGDILFGPHTSTLLDKRKKEIELKEYQDITDREIEYIDYTKWGHVCNITLEDRNNDD
jgi:hypothetical protein